MRNFLNSFYQKHSLLELIKVVNQESLEPKNLEIFFQETFLVKLLMKNIQNVSGKNVFGWYEYWWELFCQNVSGRTPLSGFKLLYLDLT